MGIAGAAGGGWETGCVRGVVVFHCLPRPPSVGSREGDKERGMCTEGEQNRVEVCDQSHEYVAV